MSIDLQRKTMSSSKSSNKDIGMISWKSFNTDKNRILKYLKFVIQRAQKEYILNRLLLRVKCLDSDQELSQTLFRGGFSLLTKVSDTMKIR